jgi:glutamate racemase
LSTTPVIGIFDSGVGGLTILRAVRSRYPQARLIYFGDTANMPYGEKSPELIRRYTRQIVRFLKNKGASLIVIACNTASAVASETAGEEAGTDCRVVDVVRPVVNHVAALKELHCIGLIATRTTIQSGVYQKLLREARPDLDVRAMATPLLAPLVEEGFAGTPVMREVIRHYLKNDLFRPIELLIPACTHYPFLYDDLNDFFWGRVTILDAPAIVAQALEPFLIPKATVSTAEKASVEIHFSMDTPSFRMLCQNFLGENLPVTETPLTVASN